MDQPSRKDYHERDLFQAYRIRRGFERFRVVLTFLCMLPLIALHWWVYWQYGEATADAFAKATVLFFWIPFAVFGLSLPLQWIIVGFARDEDQYQTQRKAYREAVKQWGEQPREGDETYTIQLKKG